MRRSFVSSLLALSLLAAGCGEKVQYYTPGQVAAALDAEGLGVDVGGTRDNSPGPGRFQAAIPDAVRRPPIRPLATLLGGVASAFDVPTAVPTNGVTVLPRRGLYAIVYQRSGDAHRRAAVLQDQLDAEQIMHRVEFGYLRRGNVIVTYRLIGGAYPALRGLGIRREGIFDPQEYNASIERRVAAALDRLG